MKRIVLKAGTSTLTAPNGSLDRVYINTLASQIAVQRQAGRQVILVTSGAIRAGMDRLGLTEKPHTIPEKQACASVGQTALMGIYADIFANYGIVVGQVLLTRDELRSRSRYIHARNTFEALLRAGVLPIVNENDTVAVEEIRVGDNDTLAALVASLTDADALILLSDVAGLFDRNPADFPDAKLIERVEEIHTGIRAMAGGAAQGAGQTGTGGMRTKVMAAQIATNSGIPMWIAHGRRANVIADCLNQIPGVGTYFVPSPTRPPARKRWIAWGIGEPQGTVLVNVCARRALEADGASLLPVGVVGADGDWAAGDLIAVAEEGTNEVFARGFARVDSSAALLSMGQRGDEIIHRDSLVLIARR